MHMINEWAECSGLEWMILWMCKPKVISSTSLHLTLPIRINCIHMCLTPWNRGNHFKPIASEASEFLHRFRCVWSLLHLHIECILWVCVLWAAILIGVRHRSILGTSPESYWFLNLDGSEQNGHFPFRYREVDHRISCDTENGRKMVRHSRIAITTL